MKASRGGPFPRVLHLLLSWSHSYEIALDVHVAICCRPRGGRRFESSERRSIKERVQGHLPRLRQAGGRRSCRRAKERRQGLLLLRQLPEGIREEPEEVRPAGQTPV